jgi:hypothetical protein
LLQLFIDPDWTNLAAATFAVFSVFVGFFFLCRESILKRFPISAFSVLTLPIFFAWLPMVFCIAVGQQSLRHNLTSPMEDFGYQFLTVLTLTLCHWLYSRTPSFGRPRFALSAFLGRVGAFHQPSDGAVWFVTAIGLGALAYSVRQGNYGADNSAGKVAALLRDLGLAPLILVFRPEPSKQKWRASRIFGLLVFGVSLIVLSIGNNSRGVFTLPAIICITVLLMMILSGTFVFTSRSWKIVLACLAATAICYPIASRLSTAMLTVRNDRITKGADVLFAETFQEFLQPHPPMSSVFLETGYSESYFKNPFLDRQNPKLIDNSVVWCSSVGAVGREKLLGLEANELLAQLPAPILKAFDVNFDKSSINKYTLADYELYLFNGHPPGSFLISSYIGDGAILFGFAYPILLALAAFLWFPILDAFALAKVSLPSSDRGPDQQNVSVERPLIGAPVQHYTFNFQLAPIVLPLAQSLLLFFSGPQSMATFIMEFREIGVPVFLMLSLFAIARKASIGQPSHQFFRPQTVVP